VSRVVADHLPDTLLSQLSMHNAIERADYAIVVCSVDEEGRPHPAMLSSLELVARDANNLRFATHASSRTTRHLKANGRLTVVLADETGVYYLKGDAVLLSASMTTAPELAAFNLRVQHVLQDNPQEYEAAKVVSGIRVRRAPIDVTHAQAILKELTRPEPANPLSLIPDPS
jgi:hypothetical protein